MVTEYFVMEGLREVVIRVPEKAVLDVPGIEKAIADQYDFNQRMLILENFKTLTLSELRDLQTYVQKKKEDEKMKLSE